MKIEALTSFCGVLSMARGEVRDYNNEAVIADLLSAGYIKTVDEQTESAEKKSKASTRKEVKADESQRNQN